MTMRIVPFRDVVGHAIGGGWGSEEAQPGFQAVRVIRGTDFRHIANLEWGEVPLRYEQTKKAQQRLLSPGDVLLEISGGSRTSGQTTGRTLFVTKQMLDRLWGDVIPASFCRRIRFDTSQIFPRYGYYALQDMYFSGRAGLYEHQSTGISNFQFEYFLDTERVWLPEQGEQHAIAEVLGSLDD
jgi:type I restriction enzyme S subunit